MQDFKSTRMYLCLKAHLHEGKVEGGEKMQEGQYPEFIMPDIYPAFFNPAKCCLPNTSQTVPESHLSPQIMTFYENLLFGTKRIYRLRRIF